MQINEESQRLLVNLDQHYQEWRRAERVLAPGRLQWKESSGRRYLYRIIDSAGNGTSLGPESAETKELYEKFEAARALREGIKPRIATDAGMWRGLKLPRIAGFAGAVLRELDIRELLGTSYLVVGTNAMTAYGFEALQSLPAGMDATDDFDLTWSAPVLGQERPSVPNELFHALKRVDRTYTVNTEREFQLRNKDGNEVELLLAAGIADRWGRGERLRPPPLPEQDWLLKGRQISQVVIDMKQAATRIVAPDPRWFGLHKLWLAQKPERDRRKIGKDERQGMLVLDLVADDMPHFPLDGAFRAEVPEALRPHLARWEARRPGLGGGRL